MAGVIVLLLLAAAVALAVASDVRDRRSGHRPRSGDVRRSTREFRRARGARRTIREQDPDH